jgi:hypothetical protein
MLRTLRLHFAHRPNHDLAFEPTDDEIDPWRLLESKADEEGWITLGDRDACRIEEVVAAELVDPELVEGPTFERDLQDEDVSTALKENYNPPS